MNLYFLVRNVHNVYIIIIVYMRVHCKLASKLEIKFLLLLLILLLLVVILLLLFVLQALL